MRQTFFAVVVTFACAIYAIQAVGQSTISAGGVIESTSGGFKFPDGTVQLSAILPPCTAITYIPYVITEEGVYCFTGTHA